MKKATITLTDMDGSFSMTIDYNGACDNNSMSHLVAQQFHTWLGSNATPQGPAMHVAMDGSITMQDDPVAVGPTVEPPEDNAVLLVGPNG